MDVIKSALSSLHGGFSGGFVVVGLLFTQFSFLAWVAFLWVYFHLICQPRKALSQKTTRRTRRKRPACVGHCRATTAPPRGEWVIAFTRPDVQPTFPSTVLGSEDREVNQTCSSGVRRVAGQTERSVSRIIAYVTSMHRPVTASCPKSGWMLGKQRSIRCGSCP